VRAIIQDEVNKELNEQFNMTLTTPAVDIDIDVDIDVGIDGFGPSNRTCVPTAYGASVWAPRHHGNASLQPHVAPLTRIAAGEIAKARDRLFADSIFLVSLGPPPFGR